MALLCLKYPFNFSSKIQNSFWITFVLISVWHHSDWWLCSCLLPLCFFRKSCDCQGTCLSPVWWDISFSAQPVVEALQCTLEVSSCNVGWSIKLNPDCSNSLLGATKTTVISIASLYMLKRPGCSVVCLVMVLSNTKPFLEGQYWGMRSWAGRTSSNYKLVVSKPLLTGCLTSMMSTSLR